MLETGHIPEKVYGALRFPKHEVIGVVCDSNDGIEREWIQQAKVLTHWFQKKMWLSRQKKIEDKMKNMNKIKRGQ